MVEECPYFFSHYQLWSIWVVDLSRSTVLHFNIMPIPTKTIFKLLYNYTCILICNPTKWTICFYESHNTIMLKNQIVVDKWEVITSKCTLSLIHMYKYEPKILLINKMSMLFVSYSFAASAMIPPYKRVFWIGAVYTSSRRTGWGNASSMTQRLRVTLCFSVHSWAGWGQMEGGVLGIRLAWGLWWEVWPRIHGGFEWEDVTSGIFTIAEKCMCMSVHINDFHLVIMRWISLTEKRTSGNVKLR